MALLLGRWFFRERCAGAQQCFRAVLAVFFLPTFTLLGYLLDVLLSLLQSLDPFPRRSLLCGLLAGRKVRLLLELSLQPLPLFSPAVVPHAPLS